MTNKTHILKWLAYFEVFQHPLKDSELAMLCDGDLILVKSEIAELTQQGKCYTFENFVSLASDVEKIVTDRKDKEREASDYFAQLPRYVRLIKKFPFVQGIGISGSLSKNVMHKNGDIDYFIVTVENRLWLCRTLLILYKKIFLLNSRKYFCLNYFVDENNLKIEDENIFTAVEIEYLMPAYNKEVFEELKKQNDWTKKHIPTIKNDFSIDCIEKRKGLSVLEKLLDGKMGEQLDLFFMRLTYNRWQKKFPNFPKQKFDQTMRTQRGISKHHPKDFQTKVLTKFESNFKTMNLDNENIIQS